MNTQPMPKKVGFYCWAGPGTIRMLKLKFFRPEVDTESLMTSYNYDYLARVQEVFGITDVWATYSWGFSPQTEQRDYDFLLSKLENFHRLGLKVHAYIQGTNLVYEDFKDTDWFCKDERGRPITYYRGRRVTCVNNPGFGEYITNKTHSLIGKGFDGVFMDNLVMGQTPFTIFKHNLPFVFAGCRCFYCQIAFRKSYGEEIPRDFEKDKTLTRAYLNFRTDSLSSYVREVSDIAKSGSLTFGTNSYDPHFQSDFTFGFKIKDIAAAQDYVLFENHSFPTSTGNKNNSYINTIAQGLDKPVFCVSYKKGIGRDSEYSQDDFNNLYSEAYSFNPCIKGSEYLTDGVWHNLRVEKYIRPHIHLSEKDKELQKKGRKIMAKLLKKRPVKNIIKRLYNPMYTLYMEKKLVRRTFERFYTLAVNTTE